MTERSRAFRITRNIIVTLVIIAVLVTGLGIAGGYLWSKWGDDISLAMGWSTNDYEGEGSGSVTVAVKKGEIGEDIAASLEKVGVVKTSDAFYELLLDQDPAVEFQPGSYKLKLKMSSEAALAALQDPENLQRFTAVIPEGKTVAQTLKIVSESAGISLKEMRAAVKDVDALNLPKGVTSAEGWLFPATYEFEEDTTGEEAVKKMVSTQKKVLAELGIAKKDQQRALIVASIVQREAGRVEDFPKVSRVIANRLDQGMKLQMDSTAQYGYGQHADGSVWSTDEALADKNGWNTYVIDGLPKSPVANPGRDAIDAAIHPADGTWLYFVAVNLDTGKSQFSTTQEEHEKTIAKLSKWCEANPGKGC